MIIDVATRYLTLCAPYLFGNLRSQKRQDDARRKERCHLVDAALCVRRSRHSGSGLHDARNAGLLVQTLDFFEGKKYYSC